MVLNIYSFWLGSGLEESEQIWFKGARKSFLVKNVFQTRLIGTLALKLVYFFILLKKTVLEPTKFFLLRKGDWVDKSSTLQNY